MTERGAQVRILPLDNSTSLPMQGGAAARLAEDATAGAEANALSAPPGSGAPLTDATLFIDQSTADLTTPGQLKHWWWWGYPAYGYGYGWGGWGYWGCCG